MRSFEEARSYVQNLNIKSQRDWLLYCRNKLKGFEEKPQDIPTAVQKVYKNEWKGFGDWLGTGNFRNKNFIPFKEARAYVQKLNLKSQKDWRLYCTNKLKGFKEKPHDIPAGPHNTYKNEWKGFDDWLGTGKLANGSWRTFKEARAYVQKLNLKGYKEWYLYCKNKLGDYKKKPLDIPFHPYRAYKDEWKGISDWLGKKK